MSWPSLGCLKDDAEFLKEIILDVSMYIYILYVLFIVYLFIFCVVKLGLVQQSFESCANMM